MNPKPVGEKKEARIPADLRVALAAAPLAEAAWNDLTPIGRRDFLSWINEAKQAETRSRRIKRACGNLAEGKRRPCCYAVVPMDLYKALGNTPAAKAQWSALTADEKRDFSDWVEASPDKAERKARIEEACALLAAGKRHPREE
ncbi:MAG: YdeI/OmpD-associated family protein [Fimbriimonadaceae bacterium]